MESVRYPNPGDVLESTILPSDERSVDRGVSTVNVP